MESANDWAAVRCIHPLAGKHHVHDSSIAGMKRSIAGVAEGRFGSSCGLPAAKDRICPLIFEQDSQEGEVILLVTTLRPSDDRLNRLYPLTCCGGVAQEVVIGVLASTNCTDLDAIIAAIHGGRLHARIGEITYQYFPSRSLTFLPISTCRVQPSQGWCG